MEGQNEICEVHNWNTYTFRKYEWFRCGTLWEYFLSYTRYSAGKKIETGDRSTQI